MTAPVYNPAAAIEGSFPTPLLAFAVIYLLDDSHSDWVELNLKAVLSCICFMAKIVEHFFKYLCAIVFLPSRAVCSVHQSIY